MINQENSQSILSCPLMNTPNQEAKNIILSSSLLMMLLEWAAKQGENDMALHQALENIMSFNDGVNPLKIDCFNVIVPEQPSCEEVEVKDCCEDDKECASEIGACLANAGVDISNIPYSDVAPIIIQNRNNEDLTSSVYGWIDAISTICLKDNGDWCLVFDDDIDERIEASLSNICSYYHSLVKEGRKIGKINESKVYINIVTIDIFVRNQPSFMIEI